MKVCNIAKIITILLVVSILFSCKNNVSVYKSNDTMYYDTGLLDGDLIIFPKNQTDAQMLSIVIKNKSGELVVIDGGRAEDAGYLYSIIKENGGVVSAWFLTHIHDDHIGAFYKIITDKTYEDIDIKNLYYHFADFDWYYKMINEDAGALLLFEDAIDNYKDINVHSDIMKDDVYRISNVSVTVLNNLYKLDSDPINNSSIAYNIKIDKCKMLVYGDLGYKGGENLYRDITDPTNLNADILVLSHHGQNGIPVSYYTYTNPSIVVWPTTKSIYENLEGKYDTDSTKRVLKNIDIKYEIRTYENTSILK